MILTGLLIVLFSVLLHEASKAIADALCFMLPDSPIFRYLLHHCWTAEWRARDSIGEIQGNILKCGMWHFFDGHMREIAHLIGGAGGILVGIGVCWKLMHAANVFTVMAWAWGTPIGMILIGWLFYRLGGVLQTWLFHVVLMGDWTFRYWWKDQWTW